MGALDGFGVGKIWDFVSWHSRPPFFAQRIWVRQRFLRPVSEVALCDVWQHKQGLASAGSNHEMYLRVAGEASAAHQWHTDSEQCLGVPFVQLMPVGTC